MADGDRLLPPSSFAPNRKNIKVQGSEARLERFALGSRNILGSNSDIRLIRRAQAGHANLCAGYGRITDS